jgi:putative membrane protein
MADAPGPSELLSTWAFDVPWIAALLAAAFLYLHAYRTHLRATPRVGHSPLKAVSFIAGLALVAVATLSPLEHYGNQVLWVNFLGFLVLTMLAAPLLVLGSPLTLAFRVSGESRRRLLRAAYRSKPVGVLTNPVVAWLLFAVVTYIWQFSSLTEVAARNVFLRDLQQITLLLVALCFWTPALAADPLRWRMPHPLRALYVFLEMTHKALFGGMFLSMNSTFHAHFEAHAPAWAPDAITDQRIAILILWIGGSAIFLVALMGIVVRWMGYEDRLQTRIDRRLRLQREAAERRRAALEQVFDRPI